MKTAHFSLVIFEKYRQKYRQIFLCPLQNQGNGINSLHGLPCHHTQLARLGFGIEHNPGLFKYPSLYLFVVHAQ